MIESMPEVVPATRQRVVAVTRLFFKVYIIFFSFSHPMKGKTAHVD
jgi:hypothetical protein